MAALSLLALSGPVGTSVRGAAPPGPPPHLNGVKDAPPPAYVETSHGSRWLAFSSYCWKSTCADFIPRHCSESGTPNLYVRRGELVSFHLGFKPKSLVISFPSGKAHSLAAARVSSWRVERRGFFGIMAYVRVGKANFDASYIGCIRLTG